MGLSVGDRVVCEGMVPCHRGRRCRSGETQRRYHTEALGDAVELVAVPRAGRAHGSPTTSPSTAGALVEPASVVPWGWRRRARAPAKR